MTRREEVLRGARLKDRGLTKAILGNARVTAIGMIASMLGGCTTLPAPEATAFRTLATADRDAFTAIAEGEANAGLGRAQRLLSENEGSVAITNCGTDAAEDCAVSYVVGGRGYDLVASSPNTRALLGAIVRYADAMADLCEAKDLDGVKAKAEGAAAAVKSLASIIPGATGVVGTIVDAAVFAGDAQLRAKRRKALRTVALAARRPIADVVPALEAQASALRGATIRATAEALVLTQGAVITSQNRERALLGGLTLDDPAVTEPVRIAVQGAVSLMRTGLYTMHLGRRARLISWRAPATPPAPRSGAACRSGDRRGGVRG